MKKVKVLVTGGGGEGAIGLIRILKELGAEVFSCDITEFASGLYLADKWFIVPKAKEKQVFVKEIERIVKENKINVILCMVHDELSIFASLKEEFKKRLNCDIITSPTRTIEVCNDKVKTINALKLIVPCPEIYEDKINYPCFIKLRSSSGTKNAFIVNDVDELNVVLMSLKKKNIGRDDLIIQEYLPGKEYIVDVLCDFNGNLIVAVPRQRILVKGGICVIGKTEKNKGIIDYVKKITEELSFFGPINIQFKEDSDGMPKLLEINPRFSGGLMITLLSGVNTLEFLLKLLYNEKLDKSELEWEEKTVFRHLTEVV